MLIFLHVINKTSQIKCWETNTWYLECGDSSSDRNERLTCYQYRDFSVGIVRRLVAIYFWPSQTTYGVELIPSLCALVIKFAIARTATQKTMKSVATLTRIVTKENGSLFCKRETDQFSANVGGDCLNWKRQRRVTLTHTRLLWSSLLLKSADRWPLQISGFRKSPCNPQRSWGVVD